MTDARGPGPRPASLDAIVTDIEGTTTSLSFVKDVLFPYARAAIPSYVRSHRDEPRVAAVLDAVRAHEDDRSLDDGAIVERLQRWIDEDRKITALKTLQGYVWEDGYRAGAFRGHVYDDAAAALRAWHAAGIRLCVFSSGSIAAQRLLFGHSDHGDLTGLFRAFFDTTTGPKRDAASYRTIARALDAAPHTVVFLSDTSEELAAAQAAGMTAIEVDREGRARAAGSPPPARTFDEIVRRLTPRLAAHPPASDPASR